MLIQALFSHLDLLFLDLFEQLPGIQVKTLSKLLLLLLLDLLRWLLVILSLMKLDFSLGLRRGIRWCCLPLLKWLILFFLLEQGVDLPLVLALLDLLLNEVEFVGQAAADVVVI